MKGLRDLGVRTVALPPPVEKRRYRIRRVQPGERLVVVALSDTVLWFETHWYCGRCKPCRGDKCRCRRGSEAMRVWWKGYFLAAESWKGGRIVLMEIPLHTGRALPILDGQSRGLRGKRLELWRENGSKNSQVLARLTGDSLGELPLEPCTVEEALEAPWLGVAPAEQRIAAEWFGDDPETVGGPAATGAPEGPARKAGDL